VTPDDRSARWPARGVGLRDACVASEILIPGRVGRIDNAWVYDNIDRWRPGFARSMRERVYVERQYDVAAVLLCQMEPGAMLGGGQEYLLRCSKGFVLEQTSVPLQTNTDLAAVFDAARPVRVIRDEALLVGRYGLITWGHWLGELLPKIVLVEARYPNRFKYVLPNDVSRDGGHPSFKSIRQSLRGYGIGDARILGIDLEQNHRFERLFAVSPVWSDHLMHPDVMPLMRATVTSGPTSSIGRLALLRTDWPGRQLTNLDAVRRLLDARGFVVAETAKLAFNEQVSLFESAHTIVAILGSALTNLIYAPRGVRVLSMAPELFGDRFFYALTALRGGRWADVRGPVDVPHERIPHLSSFSIELRDIEHALAALGTDA
jgi:hypothetical protein